MVGKGGEEAAMERVEPVAMAGAGFQRDLRPTGRELAHIATADRLQKSIGVRVGPCDPARPLPVRQWLTPGDTITVQDQSCRSTIIFLVSAIALAGDRPLGQTLAQFMMVWQR